MSTTIVRQMRFEAAHRLPYVPEGHKCRRLHGHSYQVEVHVTAPVDPLLGWVQDFGAIKDAFEPLLQLLDHHYLNEIPGLENPTSELLAAWIWSRLAGVLPGLSCVVIQETCTSRVIYTGT